MLTVIIKGESDTQEKAIIAQLKQIEGIQIEEVPTHQESKKAKKNQKKDSIFDLVGIWKDRKIDAKKLREEVWQRGKRKMS
jgi:hypothetical protein